MASYRVNDYGDDWIELEIYPEPGMPYHRVFCRTASGTTVWDEWEYSTDEWFTVTITGLEPGTDYVVNVAFNNRMSATGSTWIGASDVTTTGGSGGGGGETPESVSMYLELSGIDRVTVNIIGVNGLGNQLFVNGSRWLEIYPGSSVDVVDLILAPGYTYPVVAQGTTEWEIIDQYGNLSSNNKLEMGSATSKTFTLTAHPSTAGGLVWIQGNWYKPYIWKGGWTGAKARVWNSGTWQNTKKE